MTTVDDINRPARAPGTVTALVLCSNVDACTCLCWHNRPHAPEPQTKGGCCTDLNDCCMGFKSQCVPTQNAEHHARPERT